MVFLEDVLKTEEITNNLRYFAQYWEYYCKTIEHPSLYNTVMTPHYLVKEIIDELKTNGINNTSTFSYFFSQATFFLKYKILFTDETYSLWNLLYTKLAEKEKQIIVINSLAEKLDGLFSLDIYKKTIFEKLQNTIISPKDDFENIKKLTETVIFEFIFTGFSITNISKLIVNVFAFYSIDDYGDGKPHFHTNYPLITKVENDNYEEYVSKAKLEIESLSLEDRLNRLYSILVSDEKQYFYIFYIEGIALEESLIFDEITFYNPNKQPILITASRFDNDIFDGANYETGMNVIISQKTKDLLSGKQNAIKKLEKICDLIKLLDNSKSDFYVNTSFYKVLDENKEFHNGTMGFSKKMVTPYDVIKSNDVISDAKDLYNNIYLNHEVSEHDKAIFLDALHFFRKAKESDNLEETLLNYWISLERLFIDFDSFNSKFERTCKFVQAILIERYIYDNGWNCYNLINSLLQTKHGHMGQMIPEINFPKELQLKANIGEYYKGDEIVLLAFIDQIQEIKQHCQNLVANEIMQNTEDFYKKQKTSHKEIPAKFLEIQNNLLMIYRQRNQIVHNAVYDKNLIELNIARMKSIATIILFDLLNGMKTKKNLKSVAMDFYIKAEQDMYLAEKDSEYLFIKKLGD